MCNTRDINKLRKLYNHAEKILEEDLKGTQLKEYKLYEKAKAQSTLDYKHKYNSNLLKARLIDDDTAKVYKLIKITNFKGNIQQNHNISVEFYLKYLDAPKILDKNAIIDGSLKITITDNEKKILADGYCLGNMVQNNSLNKYTTGLPEKKYKVICIPKDYNKIKPNVKYQVIIEPVKLWLIEDTIISNNTNNDFHYNDYIKKVEKHYSYDEMEKEKFFCERCDKEISQEEYELYDNLCEECFYDVYFDLNGNYRDDYYNYL